MMTNKIPEGEALPIRVTVTNMPGVLEEIIAQLIEQQPDMTISHHEKGLSQLPEDVGTQTDVLIIGAPYIYPPPMICFDLWHLFPALKVLVMTPNGDSAVVYWLSVQHQRIKALSTQTLADSIRKLQHLDLTTQ
jgi:hypothetical protein